jgi:uncharacterized membrane protein
MRVAREHNVVVRVYARPGAFVRRGSALLTLASATDRPEAAAKSFGDAFIIGSDRTGTQDVTFFVDQLVELAVRALSPGINDPGTARLCIDRLEQALCHLAGRHMPSAERYDEDGHVRVIASPLSFRDVVASAFEEIARYGRTSVSVTCRLLEAVRNVGSCVTRHPDRSALLSQAAAIAAGARDARLSDDDRELITRCHGAVLGALHAGPGDQRAAS